MANAWNVADETLKRTQNGFVSANASKVYTCYLYKNNYTPVNGTSGGDFIACDAPGIVPIGFPLGDFGLSSVTDYVAVLTLNHALTFQASTSGSFSQVVYGYVVVDELNNYAWAERFETPMTITPSAKITITPRLKQGSCPAP